MHIRQLHVNNYRSLKKVRLGGLTHFVVLYGENDTGKSNILSFLEHVFSQKYTEEITELADKPTRVQRKPVGFWRAQVGNFSDNF